MEYLFNLVLVLMLISPLYVLYRKQVFGKKLSNGGVKFGLIANVACFFAICIIATVYGVGTTAMAAGAETVASAGLTIGDGIGLIAAALVTGMSCIGGGIAVASSASAALGAISENDKAFGKALIFVGLAEGVALYGVLISFQIISKIG